MKVTDLELTPEAMMKMGETALNAVVDHIKNLPNSPRSNLENSVELQFISSLGNQFINKI